MATDYDVVIAGAGPVGLWLASELQLAGVRTAVVERLGTPNPHPKALGIQPRTLEVFAMRGVEKQFLAEGIPMPRWHFGILDNKLDLTGLDTAYPFVLAFPQVRTEAVLEERAYGLGAEILRGREVIGLAEDESTVTVELADGTTLSSQYLVGADGSGSTVRRAAGIDFVGSDSTVFGYLGDVVLDDPPPMGTTFFNEYGAVLTAPMPGGLFRVSGYDATDQVPGRREVTLDELRATAIRIAGTDFGMRDPHWLSRFGNATRHAETYRKGRVLLAGDAAHIHFPAGGVGLNTGLQDAMNLGWKLAARVQGRAGEALLDSYHDERHPLGAAVAEHTLAQTALIAGTTPTGQAMRSLFSKLIATQPSMSLELAKKLTGLDVQYPAPTADAHPLVGARLSGVEQYLHSGRAVLLNMSENPLESASDYASSIGIETVAALPELDDTTAAIIRPDGYVWWATDRSNPANETRTALAELGTTF
jgi:2-polyprenyl-6-methoxyphenol hydroxylase-like FAD-dependent oxidoreductase